MKKNVRTKIMGTVLAAICAISAAAAISTVGVNAASLPAASVSAQKASGKSCLFTMTGRNWNYSTSTGCVEISCDFNYNAKTAKFIAKGVCVGYDDVILKTQRADGYWTNVPIRFTVDSGFNVTGKITGQTFITSY